MPLQWLPIDALPAFVARSCLIVYTPNYRHLTFPCCLPGSFLFMDISFCVNIFVYTSLFPVGSQAEVTSLCLHVVKALMFHSAVDINKRRVRCVLPNVLCPAVEVCTAGVACEYFDSIGMSFENCQHNRLPLSLCALPKSACFCGSLERYYCISIAPIVYRKFGTPIRVQSPRLFCLQELLEWLVGEDEPGCLGRPGMLRIHYDPVAWRASDGCVRHL